MGFPFFFWESGFLFKKAPIKFCLKKKKLFGFYGGKNFPKKNRGGKKASKFNTKVFLGLGQPNIFSRGDVKGIKKAGPKKKKK